MLLTMFVAASLALSAPLAPLDTSPTEGPAESDHCKDPKNSQSLRCQFPLKIKPTPGDPEPDCVPYCPDPASQWCFSCAPEAPEEFPGDITEV